MKEYEVVNIPISDGTEREFAIINTFKIEETNYIAVSLVEGDMIQDGIYLYQYTETEDGDMVIQTIGTEEEYMRAAKTYESLEL